MVRTLRVLGVLLALTLVVFVGSASLAFALTPDADVDVSIDDVGTTDTHPWDPADQDLWWRLGWGNSLAPHFTLVVPSVDTSAHGHVLGMLYSITTTPTAIDVDEPERYYRSERPLSPTLDLTLDLPGIYRFPPVGGWRPTPVTGASSDLEGEWFLNLVWFTSLGYCSTETYSVSMRQDVTAPSSVDSLTVSPARVQDGTMTILPTARANILWKPAEYDSLSGVIYYELFVDGVNRESDIWVSEGFTPQGITVENLTPGKHVIGVRAVDRATNIGPTASIPVYSDPDTPTISFSKPAGSWLGLRPALAVNTSDLGGIRHVVYRLDGHVIATSINSPFSAKPNLKYFKAGKHVLTATATDMYGRTATTKKNVRLDKVAPKITVSVSVSKLKVTVKARTSEAGAIRFWYNGSLSSTQGKEVIKYVNKAATRSVTFRVDRVPDTSNLFYMGVRVPWSVQSVDYAGNYSKYRSGRKTVRYYRIVKTANNQAKIIKY
jgi:hypothetical protein